MSGICYVNGDYIESDKAQISVYDRGFLFGEAIYEVLRVHKGKPFLLRKHYERMARGLQGLEIPCPFDFSGFQLLCVDLIARNSVTGGTIYIEVTGGAGAQREHVRPAGLRPNVIGMAHQKDDLPAWKRKFPDGVPVITQPDLRWARRDMKTTMLLPNSRARTAAVLAGAFEAVLIAPDGMVTEGAATNILVVAGGALRTHPTDYGILGGVSRATVLELALEAGIPIVEKSCSLEELLSADEAFLSGTTTDICPVVQVDGRAIGNGRPGPITRRLMQDFAALLDSDTR